MKNPKLILDYNRLSDAALSLKAINVKNSLTGNADFPTTIPSLADFTLIQEGYDTALSKIISGDRIQIALKNQTRATLLATLRQLALDIDAQANGDRAKLLSSGFDLAAAGDSSTLIAAPAEFRILDGMQHFIMRATIPMFIWCVTRQILQKAI